jgi:hypothetical protein
MIILLRLALQEGYSLKENISKYSQNPIKQISRRFKSAYSNS